MIGEKVIVRRKLCSIEQLEAILEITDSNTVLYLTCLLFCVFISYIFLNVDTYLSILGEKDFILNLWNPVIYILEYFILDLDSVIIKIIYWYIIDFDKRTGRHWFEWCWLFYIWCMLEILNKLIKIADTVSMYTQIIMVCKKIKINLK